MNSNPFDVNSPTEAPRPALFPRWPTNTPPMALSASRSVPANASPMMLAALAHAAAGRPVFPCDPVTKRPYTIAGFKDATTDPAIIIELWSYRPQAAVGMPTGPLSECIVLDSDVNKEKGLDGEASLRALEAANGPLPRTYESRTPRGGRHRFFAYPGERVPSTASKLGPALDVRGDGGYVILPPSRRPDGTSYEWVDDGQERTLAEAPAWLVKLVCRKAPAPAPFPQQAGEDRAHFGGPDPEWVASALAWVECPATHDQWLEIVMAVHEGTWGTEAGFQLLNDWSSRGPGYLGEDHVRTRWASLSDPRTPRDGPLITRATLYRRALDAGWSFPKPTVEEMFGDAAAAAAPPAPEPRVGVVVVSAQAEAAKRLVETLERAGPETPTEDIQEMVRRMAGLQADEMDIGRRLKRLARDTRVPIGDLRKVYKAEQRGRWGGAAGAAKPEAAGGGRTRLEAAIRMLAQPPVPDCTSAEDLAMRYVWVDAENAFFDRLTCGHIVRAAFDARYQHLGHTLGGGTEEDGRPPRPSDALLNADFCVKVDGEDYWPGVRTTVFGDAGKMLLNTWRDDGLRAFMGDVTLWLDHLAWLVPDTMQRKHMVQWMAYCLRHPDRKINHNIMVGGVPRIGKDSAFIPLLAGLGESNCGGTDADKLEEPYQDAFVSKKLVVLNEMHCEGFSPRKLENKLKPFGAAPPNWLHLRRFQRPPVQQRNVIQIVGFSNHRTSLSLETSAERWFAVWCAPETPKPPEYYRELHRWFGAGGAAAVIHYLLHDVSLDGFEASAPAPSTPYREQLVYTNGHASPIAEIIEEMVEARVWPFTTDLVRRNDIVAALQAVPALRGTRVTGRAVSNALLDLGYAASGRTMSMWWEGRSHKVALWAVRNVKKWETETDPAVWWAARPMGDDH